MMKPIRGFESTHAVSCDGKIISLPRIVEQPNHPVQKCRKTRLRTLRPGHNGRGYQFVILNSGDGKKERRYVHRIVAETFLDNDLQKPQVNHKDFDKKNNSLSNLEWATNEENYSHYLANKK